MEVLLDRKLSSSHDTCRNQERDKRDTLYSHIVPYLQQHEWILRNCPQFQVRTIVCFTTGPQPLPKGVLHRVRANASSFNFF